MGDDVFRDPVGEVLVLRVRAEVEERHDGARAEAGAVSASANAIGDAHRSAGTLASAFVNACSTPGGTAGRSRRTAGTGSTKHLVITACAVGPVNGGSPASISYNTQPRLYTSLRPSKPRSLVACSGLM